MVGFILAGCAKKERYHEIQLPLPPVPDPGISDGTYYQTDYGFAFPLPSKWLYLRLLGDQEADEVARFTDSGRNAYLRIIVSEADPSQKFSPKAWFEGREKDWGEKDYKVNKREDGRDLPAGPAGRWSSSLFHLSDPQRNDWTVREWVLPKDDLLISARFSIPVRVESKPLGKQLLDGAEASLSKIDWFMPIGPRGISLERYELRSFTDRFCKALESGSVVKTSVFFDEMYPARTDWNQWYQKAVGEKPAQNSLKAERTGLIINGEVATASFSISRTVPGSEAPVRSSFRVKLSKKEGSWEIVAPAEK